MGSSISSRYDDYDIYEYICTRYKQKPLAVDQEFYGHAEEILKNLPQEEIDQVKDFYWYLKFK